MMRQSPPTPIDDNVWTLSELATAWLALGEEIPRLRQTLCSWRTAATFWPNAKKRFSVSPNCGTEHV